MEEEFIFIKKKIKSMSDDVVVGDFVKWGDSIYEFKGFGHDTIFLKDIETGETKEFDYY